MSHREAFYFICVHSEGFEPSTPRAEIWYSIQLNYECIIQVTR